MTADHAETLARAGRVREALALLQKAAGANDADALFKLAIWSLTGSYVQRDLAASRRFFAQAAVAKHPDALRIYLAFVANGTGAPPDWPQAMQMLRKMATVDDDSRLQLELIEAMALKSDGDPASVPEPEPLSQSPDVALYPALLSSQECDYLVEAARPLFQPAVVVDPATGRQIPNPIRTSDSAAFPLANETPAIHALNRRIAAAAGTNVTQGEPLQVLRYGPGQEYKAHLDALPGTDNQRVATMLVYLNEGYEGGETHFFAVPLSVKGRKGDALLFRNATADGRPDERARHAGLPVTRGEKLLASRWIRARPLSLA